MDYPSYYSLNEAEFAQYPVGEPIASNNPPNATKSLAEGALIRAVNGIDIYIVKYVGSKKFKRLILSPSVFNSYKHLKWEDVIDVDTRTLDSYTTSDLVRAVGDSKVYELFPQGDTGVKRWINLTTQSFLSRGYDSDAIYEINQTDREAYITGSNIQ